MGRSIDPPNNYIFFPAFMSWETNILGTIGWVRKIYPLDPDIQEAFSPNGNGFLPGEKRTRMGYVLDADSRFTDWAKNFYKTTLSEPCDPSEPLTDLVKGWDQFALRKLDRHYRKRGKGFHVRKQCTGDNTLDSIHTALIEQLNNPPPEAFPHT